MEIYRIEHKFMCTGPYNQRVRKRGFIDFQQKLMDTHNTMDKAGWGDDGIYDEIRRRNDNLENPFVDANEYISGFFSIRQVYDWFDGFIDDLHKYGYILAVYDIPDLYVIVGNHRKQVAFKNNGYNSLYKLSLKI